MAVKSKNETVEFCRNLLKNEAYRSNFEVRFLEGKLPLSLERMVWEIASSVDLPDNPDERDLSEMTDHDLQIEAERVFGLAKELTARKNREAN